jgi:hypothetical protein
MDKILNKKGDGWKYSVTKGGGQFPHTFELNIEHSKDYYVLDALAVRRVSFKKKNGESVSYMKFYGDFLRGNTEKTWDDGWKHTAYLDTGERNLLAPGVILLKKKKSDEYIILYAKDGQMVVTDTVKQPLADGALLGITGMTKENIDLEERLR